MGAPATATSDSVFDMPRRRRHWIPLSLRMFGVMLVLLGAVRTFEFGMPIFRQKSAISRIDRTNGVCNTRDRGPDWVRRWVGDDRMRRTRLFDEVFIVDLKGTSVNDRSLTMLDGLTGLESLILDETPVTDAGLIHLRHLTNLRHLSLARTDVTDAGLVHLEKLSALESLCLNHTQISDAGLVHLKRLAKLRSLSIERTRVTENGLLHLNELTHLKDVSIRRPRASNAAPQRTPPRLIDGE